MVLDCLHKSGAKVKGVFDHDISIDTFAGLPVEHTYDPEKFPGEHLIIAIGNNRIRADLSPIIKHRFGKVMDATALVAGSALILDGAMVFLGAAIQSRCRIGRHVIVNTRAVVDHDCIVDDYAHVGPGSVICGNVNIGAGAFVGANATVLPGVNIGAWSIIGAGAVVLENVAAGATVVGNPARVISK